MTCMTTPPSWYKSNKLRVLPAASAARATLGCITRCTNKLLVTTLTSLNDKVEFILKLLGISGGLESRGQAFVNALRFGLFVA